MPKQKMIVIKKSIPTKIINQIDELNNQAWKIHTNQTFIISLPKI